MPNLEINELMTIFNQLNVVSYRLKQSEMDLNQYLHN